MYVSNQFSPRVVFLDTIHLSSSIISKQNVSRTQHINKIINLNFVSSEMKNFSFGHKPNLLIEPSPFTIKLDVRKKRRVLNEFNRKGLGLNLNTHIFFISKPETYKSVNELNGNDSQQHRLAANTITCKSIMCLLIDASIKYGKSIGKHINR